MIKKIKVSDFYKKDFVDYASYSTIRMISSAIDGLKNVNRKVIKTIKDKKIVTDIKVSQLNSTVAKHCEYLHGDMSLSIANMAQNYVGSNNIPLLAAEGAFGSRFITKPSASRYIFTYGLPVMFNMFNNNDDDIIIPQYFEGTEIEPKFYLPTLPMLLVNGSNGIASGFKQTILGRNPKNIKTYLINRLKGASTTYNGKPYFEGFKGKVLPGDEKHKWVIQGKFKKINDTTIEILDIPVGIELARYIAVLDGLQDKNVFISYADKSDKNTFSFIIKFKKGVLNVMSNDDIIEALKLNSRVGETYNALDEDLKVQVFKNVSEIMDYYYDIKIKYLDFRKTFILNRLKEDIILYKSKSLFISMIVDDQLIINKRTKASIVKDLDKIDGIIKYKNYDYLLNMSIGQLTKENLDKLKKQLNHATKEFKLLTNKTIETIWLEDLEVLTLE